MLWAKVALLSISAVLVPIFVPREYVPVNPKERLDPNPEQTASYWDLLTYTYIAPVVWKAYRMAHLPFDMLPPLPDYDHLRNLAAERFPVSACFG